MKPLRMKLYDAGKLKNSRQDIIEKDYALSYLLFGIAQQEALSKSLVFKGGTALKKMYFGDYRFSVDLDFSTITAPKNKNLEVALQNAIDLSSQYLCNFGPFELQLKRFPERNPHPAGQEAFNVNVKFPWHRSLLCTVKVEITHDEPVLLPPEKRPVLHGYDEELNCMIATYHIEEIIAEKLRALLQTHKKLITRGWSKPRARDYYDLFSVLRNYSYSIDNSRLIQVLEKKCKHRDVVYENINHFFTPELMKKAQQHWQATLGNLVVDLPECNDVLTETKRLITKLLF